MSGKERQKKFREARLKAGYVRKEIWVDALEQRAIKQCDNCERLEKQIDDLLLQLQSATKRIPDAGITHTDW